jgi:hypothetical protein
VSRGWPPGIACARMAAVEHDYDLGVVSRGDRSGAKRPTPAGRSRIRADHHHARAQQITSESDGEPQTYVPFNPVHDKWTLYSVKALLRWLGRQVRTAAAHYEAARCSTASWRASAPHMPRP